MAVAYATVIPALKQLLPQEDLDDLGRAVDFIKRLRAVTASWFVWAVVLSRFGHGHPGFEQARGWYAKLTGTTIWPRPFQMRFKQAEAVQLFSRAFEQAVAPWSRIRRRAHPLARRFADVVVVDSTVIQIADALRAVSWGTRSSAAELKVLLSISVFGALPLAAEIVAGYRHDMTLFPDLARFRAKTLLLFDKGFVAYGRLRDIETASLHYLAPMRLNGNPRIVAVYRAPRRIRRAVAARPSGIPLREVLCASKRIRKSWDLEVLAATDARTSGVCPRARLVIVPGPGGTQRPYFTNLRGRAWAPATLREMYRLRWQIELVFKELKQDLNLERLPSKDHHAVQIFAWASVLALAVSRTISTCFESAATLIGLAAAIRPHLVTRALRSMIRLVLPAALTTAATAALIPMIAELRRLATSQTPNRIDGFARLVPLLS